MPLKRQSVDGPTVRPPLEQPFSEMETIIDERMNAVVVARSKVDSFVGRNEDSFLQILSDINLAVQQFINRYMLKERVSILDYKLESEVVMGSYFFSGILRLHFAYRTADKQLRSSVILKIPQLGAFRNYGSELMLYSKERYMYETIIPCMYESWKYERVVPICYGSTDYDILVLENLRESGFYQKPQGSLLDLTGAKVVLKTLAQFHALSIKHVDKIRASLDSLTLSSDSNSEWSDYIYPHIIAKLKRCVLPVCSKQTREAFEHYVENQQSVFEMGIAPNEGRFNVIVHGDAHYYNMLFKDDQDGNVTQCKLIDFQFSRRGSPVVDIMEFFVSSVEFELLEANFESLLSCYLSELENCLKKINPDTPCPYGLQDLLEDLEKYKTFAMFPLICLIPIFWSGKREFRSIEEENEIDVVLKSPKYVSFFQGWIKYLLRTI